MLELSPEQQARLWSLLPAKERTKAQLLKHLGMRKRVVLDLEWERIDLTAGLIQYLKTRRPSRRPFAARRRRWSSVNRTRCWWRLTHPARVTSSTCKGWTSAVIGRSYPWLGRIFGHYAIENVGTGNGFSPSLKIRVTQGGTLLAEDTAWPAGMIFKRVSPGQRAAFESITRVPERSGSISYEVSMTEPYTIDYPKRR